MESQNALPDTSANPTTDRPAYRGRDAREGAHDENETYCLENTAVTIEHGPAGAIARIERADGSIEYAGPLTDETLAAIVEAAIDG